MNQPYIYIKSEPGLWTVGFYGPVGKWCAESDHQSPEAAAYRAHYLNGGTDREVFDLMREALKKVNTCASTPDAVMKLVREALAKAGAQARQPQFRWPKSDGHGDEDFE